MWRIFGTRRGGGETDLLADRLRLSAAEARRLAAEGDWVDIAEGAVLTEEGVRPEALIFLVSGEIDVLRLGAPVARCGRGNFIGEMAMLEEDAVASATSVARGPARAWRLPYDRLATLERRDMRAFGALQAAIARDMRLKIVAQNVRNAGL